MQRSARLLSLLSLLLALLCVTATRHVGAAAAEATAPAPAAASAEAHHAYVPLTARRYTMLVEELTGGLDEKSTRPTLVSVTEETTLTLPAAGGSSGAEAAAAAWEGDAEATEIDADAAAHLTFDEDFDPIWYYVLRRRGFEHLDWSGCGGKWRPEWSIPKRGSRAQNGTSTLLFDQLHHYLAHHAVCTYSAVSFCGASRERDAASQFQWAAQFISTLTSTPLSWTDASSRHTRPNGVLLRSGRRMSDSRRSVNTSGSDINEDRLGNENAASGSSEGDSQLSAQGGEDYWCSYHLVYHDTLCTQHVSPLLNGGRSGRGVQEGLPPGIFKAVFPSFVHFFGSPFHHFTVKAQQERKPANATASTPATVELTVQVRMSMVARERSDLTALADVWTRELPAYAREGRLAIHIGPGGLSKRLRTALPPAAIDAVEGQEDEAPTTRERHRAKTESSSLSAYALSESGSGAVGWSPEVQYEVHSHGKDHGYLTVELQPALATLDAQAGVVVDAGTNTHPSGNGVGNEGEEGSAGGAPRSHQYRLRAGDVVRTLLLFPLHLLRPSLHNMESLLGSTRVVQAHTDISANTLALLLETPVTAVHVAAYEAAYAHAEQRHRRGNSGAADDVADTSGAKKKVAALDAREGGRPEGVMLARLPLFFGWTALHEMPPDDNSNRVLPQPVVMITRHVDNASADDFCAVQRAAGRATGHTIPPLDHVRSLATVFQLLNKSFVWRDGKTAAAGSPSPLSTTGAPTPASVRSGEANTCVYWVRSTAVSGTTIPGPDGAMVFNVLSLGLVFSAVGAGILTRFTRRLTLLPEDLAALVRAEAS